MSLAFWRDVSIVWLSLFCLIGLIIPLAVFYFAVRGMNKAHQATFSLMRRAQGYSQRARQGSAELSRRVAKPIIKTQREAARWQTTIHRLWPGRS